MPTSASASSVTIGTQRVGNLSISHSVGGSTFQLDSNPNAEIQYGFKTQRTNLTVDNDGLNISNLRGDALN